MFHHARRAIVIAAVGTAITAGIAGTGTAAFADTTVSPTLTVPAPSGGSCFTVVVLNATFNPNGTPSSITGGSVTFNKPGLSCI